MARQPLSPGREAWKRRSLMPLSLAQLEVTRTGSGVRIAYDGAPMVVETGAGIPLGGRWWWSFDGSLRLVNASEHAGSDQLGAYAALALTYTDQEGPLIRQTLKTYAGDASLVVETTALGELGGAALADSFFHTTFNSPVVRLADGLSYLVYTWGLADHEGVGIGGHFPDAVVAADLASLPEQLRRADFSPLTDVHQRGEKPSAPFIASDPPGGGGRPRVTRGGRRDSRGHHDPHFAGLWPGCGSDHAAVGRPAATPVGQAPWPRPGQPAGAGPGFLELLWQLLC